MAHIFPLTVLTPERVFFKGDAISITVESLGGRLSVLKDHIPMVTALEPGLLVLRTEEGEKQAFHSDGFMEVTREETVLLLQAAEWPDEIDAARAAQAEERARKRMQERGISDRQAQAALMRALARQMLGRRD